MDAAPTRHLAYLDGLRGVLAVYVAGHHLLGLGPAPGLPAPLGLVGLAFGFGHAAVCAFIVVSGFSLMLPVAASADGRVRGGLRGYLGRRARRILPAYYAALAISAAAAAAASAIDPRSPAGLTPAAVLSHALLVHTWVRGQAKSINAALWSVATEWHIYFLFPAVLLPIWRRLGPAGLVASAFAIGVAPQVILTPGSDLLEACPWFVGLFATGMAAAVAVDRGPPPPGAGRRRPGPAAVGLAACLAYGALKALRPGSDVGGGPLGLQWLKDGACGLAVACLLVALTRRSGAGPGAGGRRGPVLRVLESAAGRRLGLLSYSLYATHCAVLRLLSAASWRLGLRPAPSFALMALVGLPASIGLAYLTSRLFEVPFLPPRARPDRAAAGGGP